MTEAYGKFHRHCGCGAANNFEHTVCHVLVAITDRVGDQLLIVFEGISLYSKGYEVWFKQNITLFFHILSHRLDRAEQKSAERIRSLIEGADKNSGKFFRIQF